MTETPHRAVIHPPFTVEIDGVDLSKFVKKVILEADGNTTTLRFRHARHMRTMVPYIDTTTPTTLLLKKPGWTGKAITQSVLLYDLNHDTATFVKATA